MPAWQPPEVVEPVAPSEIHVAAAPDGTVHAASVRLFDADDRRRARRSRPP